MQTDALLLFWARMRTSATSAARFVSAALPRAQAQAVHQVPHRLLNLRGEGGGGAALVHWPQSYEGKEAEELRAWSEADREADAGALEHFL